MGMMADRTILMPPRGPWRRLMLAVTFDAKFRGIFGQQKRQTAAVRLVAEFTAPFSKRPVTVRQRPFGFNGAVTLTTGFSPSIEQQRLVLPTMWRMTAGAVTSDKRTM